VSEFGSKVPRVTAFDLTQLKNVADSYAKKWDGVGGSSSRCELSLGQQQDRFELRSSSPTGTAGFEARSAYPTDSLRGKWNQFKRDLENPRSEGSQADRVGQGKGKFPLDSPKTGSDFSNSTFQKSSLEGFTKKIENGFQKMSAPVLKKQTKKVSPKKFKNSEYIDKYFTKTNKIRNITHDVREITDQYNQKNDSFKKCTDGKFKDLMNRFESGKEEQVRARLRIKDRDTPRSQANVEMRGKIYEYTKNAFGYKGVVDKLKRDNGKFFF
jgi:hypothetical protein